MKYDEALLLKTILGLEPQDVVAKLLEDAPKGTWTERSDWAFENFSQTVLKVAAARVYDALGPINQAEDGTPSGELAGRLRDDLDILWRVLSEENQAEIERTQRLNDLSRFLRAKHPAFWRRLQCSECSGSGRVNVVDGVGATWRRCGDCKGTGIESPALNAILGLMAKAWSEGSWDSAKNPYRIRV